ncbi:MAG: hypothetical protein ABH828_05580 [archaeon]
MEESVLRGTLSFLNELGIYDVVLPFLLSFTIVFAILEKTKIFGVEDVDGKKITRKNLNAMTAFVMGFFVVASTKLVALINTIASQAFLLLLLVVLFLMLAGVLVKEGEFELKAGWKNTFMVIAFIVILLIFLEGIGWLNEIWAFLVNNWNKDAISAIILLVLIGIFIAWLTHSKDENKNKKKEEKGD